MIQKLIAISGVGRFLSYKSAGDTEFRKYTVIFAENGRGKTTLCAILRSLQSSDPSLVLGRTALGGSGAPEIQLRLDNEIASFRKGSWNRAIPQLAIFDSIFVSENIYSGDAVALTHKRNLYKVILGKQGVAYATAIEELDARARAKGAELRDRLKVVRALVPEDQSLEAFLALEPDVDIEARILGRERALKAVLQAGQIRAREELSEVTFPKLPAELERLLAKTLDNVAEDAEEQIDRQVVAHGMGETGEEWLSEGLTYVHNNKCPFCGQGLDNAEVLVSAYRACFSSAYHDLKNEVAALREDVEESFGDRQIAKLEVLLRTNAANAEFWAKYCDLTAPHFEAPQDELFAPLRVLRGAILSLLTKKAAKPLDALQPDVALAAAQRGFQALAASFASYNQATRRRMQRFFS